MSTRDNMQTLRLALHDMVALPWGSEMQIEAENLAFDASAEVFGVDWDDSEHQRYLLKATTPEMADYIREVCKI